MSPRNQTKPQYLGPERLKPAEGPPILDASVEAQGPATDLCTGRAPRDGARRALILAWLAGGAREVTWALCSLARDHWAELPPARLSDWPALRHAQHLALYESRQTLPAVRAALGDSAEDTPVLSTLELAQADAAWDPVSAKQSADAIVREIAETRFELLRRVETALDADPAADLEFDLDFDLDDDRHRDHDRGVNVDQAHPGVGQAHPGLDQAHPGLGQAHPGLGRAHLRVDQAHLDWLLLSAKQHELQHLAAIWRIALNWDRVSLDTAPTPGVPLHPADRLEESH